MKKNIIVVLGSISFATLFNDQGLGLNSLLYALFLIGIASLFHLDRFKRRSVQLSMLAMIATSAAIILHGSTISMICYFISILGYLGYLGNYSTSLYISWMNGLYTSFLGSFHRMIHNLPREQTPAMVPIKTDQLLKVILIPLALVFIFILLYSQTNPVFAAWLDRIDIAYINFPWVLMALLGGLITANTTPSHTLEQTTQTDILTGNALPQKMIGEIEHKKAINEIQIGTFTMIALNSLLTMVLISEVIFIVQLDSFKASTLSNAVHAGVYASIASIVLAVVIIVFLFRGTVNFITKNQSLKKWAYLWIALNSFLILSISYKTFLYIDHYGLSLKRLGVLVYLLLCVIGLITTFYKIKNQLNLTYLFRKNVAFGFGIVLVYSCFNWSAIVTRYNVKNDYVSLNQFHKLLPQNILVLQEYGIYDDVVAQNEKKYADQWNEDQFTDRNWQDYNYIADKMIKTSLSHAKD